MVFEIMFTCTVVGKKYFVKDELQCNSCNAIYLVEWTNCKQQYIGSALSFKQRLRPISLTLILTKIVVGLLGILITYAVTLVILIII